jgi:DNA (cytosine-5)-methyltransferase 1
MKLLDLYCKAGGASKGYANAGFEVVGIDIKKQKRYPYEFIQADCLEILQDLDYLRTFDVIAASPPCQTHSATKHLRNAQGKSTDKVDLIPQTREALIASGVPYVIENVPGAPLINPVQFCGSSFGFNMSIGFGASSYGCNSCGCGGCGCDCGGTGGGTGCGGRREKGGAGPDDSFDRPLTHL